MEILKNAVSGTLESSDVFITVTPGNVLEIEIESVVKEQYGNAIKSTVSEVLESFGIKKGKIEINDHGALDCVIRARMETAIKRGAQK